MKIRMQYSFTGFVQGVGFRYTAFYTAQSLGLTGFVRNEDDGSVTVQVQGEEAVIRKFLEMLDSGRWIRIEGISTRKMELLPEDREFYIDY
jgi:acylphosphatase